MIADILKAFASRKLRRLRYMLFGFALVMVAVLVYGLFTDSKGVNRLEVGDCFVMPDSSREVQLVDVPGCNETHDAQVFAAFDADSMASEEVSDQCAAELQHVDPAGRAEALEVRSYIVSRQATPRKAICFVMHPTPVTEPALVLSTE